jgi:hypothetical protein
MKVIDLKEAKANLEVYAEECQQTPVIVTIGGLPKFELVPIQTDDPDFIDRLLEENESFRRLAEESRREADEGRVSTLADVRKRLEASTFTSFPYRVRRRILRAHGLSLLDFGRSVGRGVESAGDFGTLASAKFHRAF